MNEDNEHPLFSNTFGRKSFIFASELYFMIDENLGSNMMFMVDAIVKEDIDNLDDETREAALLFAQIAWNTEIGENSIPPEVYTKGLQYSKNVNQRSWEHLIRNNSEELIDILRQRKRFFFNELPRSRTAKYQNEFLFY